MSKLKLFTDSSSTKSSRDAIVPWQIVLFDDNNHYLDNLLLVFFSPPICKLRQKSDEQNLDCHIYINSYLDSCGRGMKNYL